MGSGLLYLQFRVGGNGVKSSGPSVRLDLLTFDYKEAMKAGTEKGNGSGVRKDLLTF